LREAADKKNEDYVMINEKEQRGNVDDIVLEV